MPRFSNFLFSFLGTGLLLIGFSGKGLLFTGLPFACLGIRCPPCLK
jgi:hypothetical protein